LTERFPPHLEILPDAQRTIWPELKPLSDLGYVLYGGTAIALRLGHRTSIDFDFFSEKELRKEALADRLPFVETSRVLQDQPNTFTVLAHSRSADGPSVKLSFFGAIAFGRVGIPQTTQDGVLQVASLDDLMATKGGDLATLPADVRKTLIVASSAVRSLPDVRVISRQLFRADRG
jgi:hypothetical protein